jgi:hypothetical protein
MKLGKGDAVVVKAGDYKGLQGTIDSRAGRGEEAVVYVAFPSMTYLMEFSEDELDKISKRKAKK